MIYSLPKVGKAAIRLSHFPTRHQAFIFRAYEYVPAEKIAKILGTTVEKVHTAAEDMGLPKYNPADIWLKRGYITIIRRMWHILPYEQLLELLDMDEPTLAAIMREEDFLDIKLGEKPLCEPVFWRELDADERERTRKIKSIMAALDTAGKAPFEFEYKQHKLHFEGKERFKTRMIYAFSGLYQRAFDVDSEEFLPDGQLLAYQSLGINGIWTQGVLSQLTEFPFEPSLSRGYEERLGRMRALTERLDKYGMKLYLYINEPRAMPLEFFDKHPDLRGHTVPARGLACLCTSNERVQSYLCDSIEKICREVPLLGGFFTITRSENATNCYSHSDGVRIPCTCPRCQSLSVGEVIGRTIGCIRDGIRRVSPDIKLFAWSWQWNSFSEDITKHLPTDVILLSQSELDVPYTIGGVSGNVIDYSMSIKGPGELARGEWKIAKERGMEIGAKVQINTTWEASTVPAIPVLPSVEEHIRALSDEGVEHLLLSWTLGGYPGNNIAAAAKYFYEKCSSADPEDTETRDAQIEFSRAFSEFPFDVRVLYNGPQNSGPSNLLFEEPTGYRATMTCFAYDDLERWRGNYPAEVLEEQFARLCEGWQRGIAMLPEGESEVSLMARAAYCLFKSSLNQIRFVRARDEERFSDAASIAKEELAIARDMLALMNKNAAIGYEAANHYYFSKGQITEKILNCHHVIERFGKE